MENNYGPSEARDVFRAFFDDLADRELNVKGIIVDLRGSTGGDRADAGYILGRMIDAPLTFAYSRTKIGEGRLDYSPWAPIQIMPAPAAERRLGVPVALLVDKAVNSASEFVTRAVQNMSNGTVIGETTGGASTTTRDVLNYNGGFSGSLFWTSVNMAVAQYRNTDGTMTEGFGLPPDIEVFMEYGDWMEFYDGIRDKVLDRGIAHIRSVNP
jgi:C-terminal processing protease CtpA/Prc